LPGVIPPPLVFNCVIAFEQFNHLIIVRLGHSGAKVITGLKSQETILIKLPKHPIIIFVARSEGEILPLDGITDAETEVELLVVTSELN
jgi:hypothetical protein